VLTILIYWAGNITATWTETWTISDAPKQLIWISVSQFNSGPYGCRIPNKTVNEVKKFTQEQGTKTQGVVEVQLYSFFNFGATWGGWSTPRPGHFTSVKETRYPLYRRLGRPQGRSGPVRKISPPTGIRSPNRQARSESLYRLSYPGSQQNC